MMTAPLMVFITLSVDDKNELSTKEIFHILSMFLCIFFGSLILTSSSVEVAVIFLTASLSMSPSIFLMYADIFEEYIQVLRSVRDATPMSTQVEVLFERRRTMKTRKLTLATSLCVLFPLFPMTYAASATNLISDDLTRVLFMLLGFFVKGFFSSLCMDAHLEVSVPSVSPIAAEAMIHTSKKEFLRFVFHELRGPLNSILLGTELLWAKVTD